jgi:uncharacterized protein YjbI with pentapeptide repeats
VELAGVRKSLRCTASVAPGGGQGQAGYARLLLDHRHVWTGLAQENPCGTSQEAATLHLQNAPHGSVASLAATGALATPWPTRARWRPQMAGTLELAATDGSHLGWPAHTDLRYFQQAAPDQWAQQAHWPLGARYVLQGCGPRGQGFANALPRLLPHAAYRLHGSQRLEPLALAQQSVWFLPDDDMGVLWWHGRIALAYMLEDGVQQLVAALRGAAEPQDQAALEALARQRFSYQEGDLARMSEQAVMPRLADGWTWQHIGCAEEHPQEAPAPKTYEELRQGVDAQQELVDELVRRQQAQDPALQTPPRSQPAAAVLLAAQPEVWQTRLAAMTDKVLRNVTLEGQNLRGLHWSGWTLENVVFRHCDMERSHIEDGSWKNVQLEQCSLKGAVLQRLQWTHGRLESCHAGHSQWQQLQLQELSLSASDLAGACFSGGAYKQLNLADLYGAQGQLHGVSLEACCLQDCKLPAWHWQQLGSKLLVMVRCQLPGLQVQRSRFASFSAVAVDFSNSHWQVCSFAVAVFDKQTQLRNSQLSDCQFQQTSAVGLQAAGLRALHCSFAELNAPQLQAPHSQWTACVLQGARLAQACLQDAAFDGCALRDARLFGADLQRSRVRHSNLIGAQSCWALTPGADGWHGNLTAGYVDLPRRQA